MDAATENQPPLRPSGLKPPTKFALTSPPSKLAGLSEMSDTGANARGGTMGPPNGMIKRKNTGTSSAEPPPPQKRKTLQEKAGEPYNSKMPAPASSRPVNNAVKGAVVNGVRTNFSRSTSGVPSNPSRHTSAASFGSSVGYGPSSRASNSNNYRPRSVQSGRNPSSGVTSRSSTAMSQRTDEGKANRKVFDTEARLETMEQEFAKFRQQVEGTSTQNNSLQESVALLKSRVAELEAIRTQITTVNEELKTELNEAKHRYSTLNLELDTARRNHVVETDDLRRRHRNDMEDIRDQHRKESDRTRRENEEAADKVRKDFESQIDKLLKLHSDELAQMEKRLKVEVEEERSRRVREVQDLQSEYASKIQNVGVEAATKEHEIQNIKGELINVKSELDRERALKTSLQEKLAEASSHNITLETANKAMKDQIDFLQSDNQAQSQAFQDLHQRMQDAIEAAEQAQEKLRQEETLRRKLHNQVQELKGNIRVMCRVRPTNPETEIDPAKIAFPDADTDSKEVAITGPEQKTALGNDNTKIYNYSFDRVFSPSAQNGEVFEEISQLVQSALDGYNVCIFCYGQTGSGKTYTMTSPDGMIPRAVQQIWAEAQRLEEKGWRYKMEGSFVEVYNENVNDLLGRSEDLDKKKVEIRHDQAKKQTTLENAVTIVLDGPGRVNDLLNTASKNRSVAATKANSRSSRSHSVFILKLVGENGITGERSEGTLNLVDLAGSERLEHSKVEGARLKETQNINKSLSCLGDVINALGNQKEGGHVPYRNSKLTYLLQYSLGGNSKTLMFVMISPLQAHLQETVTSLKFATKVHNTHIGTAKKQTKSRD
ncbi:kinesin-domain-containing protein [Delitschia confertaspora ATCC 74209]|uniref:Kinesin-like protein n=1 Tax=Delitschia confertaspora ATCC 74209 TaxID=1513339 RepID=A0A9P4MRY4_9PLEO|nr:kinesin-domain-containing protein [Delitschia confertaspora ATCC 74209]